MSSTFRLSAAALCALVISACTCGGTSPAERVSPSLSLVQADASALADGETLAEVTVTVLDHDGNPLTDVMVVLSTSRDTDDVITQPEALTGSDGVATGTVASMVIGTTTVSATAAGIALEASADIQFVEACSDGEVDCGTDGCQVLGSLDHCAACGDACSVPPNATGLCEEGACDWVCASGYANCDDDAATGCETDVGEGGTCPPCPDGETLCGDACLTLGSLEHCTDCNDACTTDLANAAPVCTGDGCDWACLTGYGSCDDDPLTGCEAELDGEGQCPDESCPEGTVDCDAYGCVTLGSLDHCEDCNDACPSPDNGVAVCTATGCGIDCNSGYDECESAPGVCTPLDTVANCSMCGEACTAPANAYPICSGGSCEYACESGYGLCEGTGECVLLGTAENCASCGDECEAPANAFGVCENGLCDYECDTGYGNCDLDDATGCEEALDIDGLCASGCPPGEDDCGAGCEPLDTVDDCGACGNDCPVPDNATAVCERYQCGFVCDDGWGDCDDDATNGCEQSLDVIDHCGDCDVACDDPPNAVGFCDGEDFPAACSYDCDEGYADCNYDAADGCETDLTGGTCCDDDSFMTVTETCLTAEAGAELVVHVEIVDAIGQGVSGADVVVDAGGLVAIGDVVESTARPGVYWIALTAPEALGTFEVSATADAGACGAAIAFDAVEVEVRGPVAHEAGGTGGCSPRGGNLRVRAVDEAGAPLEDAFVMVGPSGTSSAHYDDYEAFLAGSGPGAPNHGRTDDEGYLVFRDFGTVLADASRLITAGADGRAYTSLVGFDVADVVLILEEIPDLPARVELSGDVTPPYVVNGDGRARMALVTQALDIGALSRFQLTDLLEDEKDVQRTSICQSEDFTIPRNIHLPEQDVTVCVIEGDPPEWQLAAAPSGLTDLTAVQGEIEIFDAINNAESMPRLISAIEFKQVGLLTGVSTDVAQADIDVELTADLTATLPVTAENAPQGELYVISVGDLDGENGTGRLYVQGVKVEEDATEMTRTLTTVEPVGPFADASHLAMALSIVYGSGASGVLDRTTTDRTTARVLDDFFSTPSSSVFSRSFSWGDVSNVNSPSAPHVSRSVLRRATPMDAAWRSEEEPFWVVYAPGDIRSFTLPSLPVGAPRYTLGGYLEPTGDQTNRWFLGIYYLGISPVTFDPTDFAFSSVEAGLTHLSISERLLP